METLRALALLFLFVLPVIVNGWGKDGSFITCKIAQGRLSQAATDAVKSLLPDYAMGDLTSLCSWADQVVDRYPWSSRLHYIDTSNWLCYYNYNSDCKDKDGVMGRCVAGAINNYTTQLLDYRKPTSKYNHTEALLFLSHFMGDIHQPPDVRFPRPFELIKQSSQRKVTHHAFDDTINDFPIELFYGSNDETYIDEIQTNITKVWADEVQTWEKCSGNELTCPNIYITEGLKEACYWSYKRGDPATIRREYIRTRLSVLSRRFAQGGVRLAATLNRIILKIKE